MGNDGGSIPDRRDLVKTRPKAEQADKANQTRAKWLFCALSKRRLQEPIVSCDLGKLYNKDSILEYLLDKTLFGDGETICGHIRSLKDVKTLNLSPNTSVKTDEHADDHPQFCCPYTMKEMNGSHPFVYISKCGCVSSLSGLREMSSTPPDSPSHLDICPQCSTKYDRNADLVTLNPPPEEEQKIRLALQEKRANEPTKAKKDKKSKKRKIEETLEQNDSPEERLAKKKTASASPVPNVNPSMTTSRRAVKQSLAEEEAKRKAGMSEAIKSLYGTGKSELKETFMTRGTFTRYA